MFTFLNWQALTIGATLIWGVDCVYILFGVSVSSARVVSGVDMLVYHKSGWSVGGIGNKED